MAPEQFRGKPQPASDQYALAIVAYEWLTGTPPFTEGNFIQIGYQHNFETPLPLRAKVPMLAQEVEQVILKALKKQPTERFLTIQAFAEALEESSRPKASKVSIGTTLLTYRGHSKFVFAVAWSPDGTRLASGSSDNTVQVWQAV